MTLPEVLLWQRLRRGGAGIRVRRQHPIGPYIADFYCAGARLVIEVDGAMHAESGRRAHDMERDRFMIENGLRVVRVDASQVLDNPDRVAAAIATLAARPLHRPADGPPPRTGEDPQ